MLEIVNTYISVEVANKEQLTNSESMFILFKKI